MATSPPRSLRVGLVLSGQLVEERLFDGTTPVTFGQALRCTLSVPVEGVPREHVLFAPDQGRFVLRVPAGMTGRLASDAGEVDVAAGEVALPRGVRGKLTLGQATILIQDVATPPRAPRMTLPASLKGTLADRIDRRLALIIGGSLVVHVAVAVWAWSEDVPHANYGMPYVAATYHHETIDMIVPDVVEPTQPGAATPVLPARAIVQPTRITTRPERPPNMEPGGPAPTGAIDSQRLANILTGGDGDDGVGGMNPRQPGAELSKQINDARNKHLTIGDGSRTSRVDDRAHVADNDRAIATDPTLTRVPTIRRDEPTGRIITGNVKPDGKTTLTPATVLERITTVYMAGLQRCYRLGLATDATLAGRVTINFTVDERGKVIDPDASGMSALVDGCISNQMTNWRFPIPKDNEGDATDATFAVSLALQPS